MSEEGSDQEATSTAVGMDEDAYLRAVASAPERTESNANGARASEGSTPKPGQLLAGKYRVDRVLGAGGMGIVVAARHVNLDAPVALKFMTDETLADQGLVSRFLREARATARLRGEHVIRVSDVGELDSGAPYMVMEYLQGQDLAALLTSLGRPPISSAVEYAIQACEGLDEAHRAGIVHRDIKPSNLFLTRRPNGTPCIKVLDFGISKAVTMVRASENLHSTSDQAIFGTPLYMAPEQMRATRDVDARADLWSLGASLYELLSGAAPFPAESIVDLAYRIANEAPPSLRASRPEIPEGLERIVLKCLERDCDRRFADARSLAIALENYRTPGAWEIPREASEDEEMTVIDPHPIEPPRASPVPDAPAASIVNGRRSHRFATLRRRRSAILYGIGVVCGAGGIAAVGLSGRDGAAPRSSTSVVIPPTAVVAPTSEPVVTLTPLVESAAPTAVPPTVSVTDLPVVALAPPLPSTASSLTIGARPALTHADRQPQSAGETIASKPSAAATASAGTTWSSCSPPYYYDELGLKIFKPECVN